MVRGEPDRCIRDQLRCMHLEESFFQEEINNTSEKKGFFSKLFKS